MCDHIFAGSWMRSESRSIGQFASKCQLLCSEVGPDVHVGSAAWATPCCWCGTWKRRWRSLAGELLASQRDESSPASVGEIAEVADADEAPGQHMLAEAAQELACRERHDALLVAMRVVFPSEAHMVPIEAEQALVADGDAVCIAAKISQHANGISESRLGIDHPVAAVECTHEC